MTTNPAMTNPNHHPAERIRWIIDEFYNGHPKRLADALGASPATFTQILNKGAFPSWKIITAILRLHADVNPDWLLHGKTPNLRDLSSNHHQLYKKNMRLRQMIERFKTELEKD